MKKIFSEIKNSRTMANLFVVLCGIIFYLLCENIGIVGQAVATVYEIFSPVIWGSVIAYMLNPIAMFVYTKFLGKMQKKKVAWSLSVVIAFLFMLAIIGVLILMVIPQLISSVSMLGKNFGNYYNTIKDFIVGLDAKTPFIDLDVEKLLGSWSDILSKVTELIGLSLTGIANATYSVGSKMINFALALVMSVYMLFDKETLRAGFKRLATSVLKDSAYANLRRIGTDSNKIFLNYIGGNLLDSLIVGVVNIIVMLILRMPYPLLITVIVALTNLIPTFGPIIGAVPCLLILLIINPLDALWFLILVVVLQTIDGNVIKPLVLGSGSGVRPVWVLISIILGGRMFGIIGMILAIPVFAILSNLVNERIKKRLEKKKPQTEVILDE